MGITVQFAKAREYLLSRLKPETASAFLAVLHTATAPNYAMQNISNYFIGGFSDISGPTLANLFAEETDQGKHVPTVPVFAYKAIADELSPVQDTDAWVEGYCRGGAQVLLHRNTASDHLTEFVYGHSRSLEWLSGVFNGTHQTGGCVTLNVTVVELPSSTT